MRFFVELVGHYPLHMVESSNGTKELQRDSFRKSHPSRGVRHFLQLFMETQMFAGFIQDKELRKGGGRGDESQTLRFQLMEKFQTLMQDGCSSAFPAPVPAKKTRRS